VVDKALILRKLAEVEEYLGQIREYENIAVEQYAQDWKIQRIVERTLQIMIETCVDIAAHIISDKGFRTPKSYADTFSILYERGILAEELFKKIDKMAKFRDIVVHHYDKVDAEILSGILQRDLGDFLSYKNAIVAMLKTEPS